MVPEGITGLGRSVGRGVGFRVGAGVGSGVGVAVAVGVGISVGERVGTGMNQARNRDRINWINPTGDLVCGRRVGVGNGVVVGEGDAEGVIFEIAVLGQYLESYLKK